MPLSIWGPLQCLLFFLNELDKGIPVPPLQTVKNDHAAGSECVG